jgi:TRAP-type mannitol/chloroaromatic compound transport system permease small subunit
VSIINHIDRLMGVVTSLLNMAGTILIFFLLVIINIDVFGRYFLNRPVVGVVEMVIVATTAVVYFQIAHALREGRMVKVDTLLGILERRRPRSASVVKGLYNIIGAATFALIMYYTYPFLERTLASGDVYGNPLVFGVPKWPVRLVMLIGCGAVVLQFLVLAAKDFVAARDGAETDR